jgi:anti-anti-sigma factor
MEVTITSVEHQPGVSIIQVVGNVDSSTAGELQKKVTATIASGANKLIFDLKDVPYMSSAGLRVLLKTFQSLRGTSPLEKKDEVYRHIADGSFHDAHLKLLNPTPRVLEVLKIAGFDMLVSVEHDINEALKFD